MASSAGFGVVISVVVVALAVPRPGRAVERDPRAQDEDLAKGIKNVIQAYVRKAGVASPDREAIAAMAAVVGERCQEVAGEFPVRKHTFVPGQRIFSDRVNVLLAGDGRAVDLDGIPSPAIYGQIRDEVDGGRYPRDRFPALKAIFQGFASRIGKPEDWGKVPLSLPAEDWPRLLPLRAAFDTRNGIDAVLGPIKGDKERALRVSTRALTLLLNGADQRLDPGDSLALALETINGMAKTAPMLAAIAEPTEAMREAQHQVIKVGTPTRPVPHRAVIRSPRLGVLNLLGNKASLLIAEDLAVLTPLFGKAAQSTVAPPACDVLFIYARVLDSGAVDGSKVGLREIIRDSGATIVVVATENSGDGYIAGAPPKPYGSANLVMTLARRGPRFSSYFERLFKMMFAGETMPVAWVTLSPQVPHAEHADTPEAIFAAEAGQVTFK